MNETQRNIKRYKAALPGLRERITAAALLLVVSLSMVVSASFAWYTISSAPEVSMMATTIAANGNLEIALADGLVSDGQIQPNEVAIGDSASAEGKNILSANITWGNLVNLSDKSYGLGEISLRPAKLSGYNLGRTPLYGATYSQDGRVVDIDEYYHYTSYTKVGDKFDFSGKSEHLKYGVRAISSVQLKADSANAELNKMYAAAEEAFKQTVDAYNGIIQGKTLAFGADTETTSDDITCMAALVELLEIFVNEKASEVLANNGFGSYTPSNYASAVPGLYQLLLRYQEVLDKEGETLRQLANMQVYVHAGKNGIAPVYFENVEQLRTATTAQLSAVGITSSTLKSLSTHKTDCNSLQSAIVDMGALVEEAKTKKIYWDTKDQNGNEVPSISGPVSKLVDISKTFVGSSANSLTNISSMGGNAALDILKASPIHVEIRAGLLKNTEQRIGSLLLENDDAMIPLGTRVWVNLDVPIYGGDKEAAVRTDAGTKDNYYLKVYDMEYAAGLQPAPTDYVKKDTYGFSIDFWVRTNGDNSILTLEGSPEYETRDAKCTNINGEETQVWIASKTVEIEQEGTGDSGAATIDETDTESGGDSIFDDLLNGGTPTETITMDVYKLDQTVIEQDENGKDVEVTYHYVYDVNTHVILGTEESLGEEGYTFAKKEIKVITGYDGVDRIWEDMASEGLLLEDNLTQGSGSCYVFYADPSDQDRILDMLRYFTIAFLDSENYHVATAKLDVDSAYAINGKVTVPLVMVKGPEYEAEDDEGNTEKKRGIVALPRSTPTWLTAIVYVDGEDIGNENVLEAGVVEGRLNLQFGSADILTGAQDLPLQQKYRTITVTASSGSQTSDKSDNPITYSYDGNAKKVTVQLRVEGDQPTSISGFFTRMIGKNHGTKMESKDFTRTALEGNVGTWEAEFELSNPGNYVFLSVLADGAEYEFDTAVDASGNTMYDTDGNVVRMAPAVKISGREILSLSCDPAGGVYYTSAESMEITVDASIAASPNLAPKQVRALFSTSDGKEFTVILGNTGNGETASHWNGTARITEGGTYTLEYLVVDGDKSELTAEQKKDNTYVVKLGVRAEIECDKIQAVMKDDDTDATNNPMQERDKDVTGFAFEREVDHYVMTMKVKLYDNRNNELRSLSGTRLKYLKEGSTEAGKDNLDMSLSWKETDGGYYEGKTYVNNVGTYKFFQITIPTNKVESVYQTTNYVTSVQNAPVFSLVSPEPPAWYNAGEDNSTPEYQYAPTGNAKMYAYFTNADTAVAYAQIRNEFTGETQWKQGSIVPNDDDVAVFAFDVPTNSEGKTGVGVNGYHGNATGKQDGQWVIDAVCLQNVYEKRSDGTELYHPEAFENDAPVGGMFFSENGTYDPNPEESVAIDDDEENTIRYYKGKGMSNIKTEVVQTIFTTLTASGMDNNNTVTLGKDGATFMTEQSVSGVQVTVCNWNGKVVKDNDDEPIEVAGLAIDYNRSSSSEYGGYTIPGDAVIFDPNWSQMALTLSDNTPDDKEDNVNYTAATKNLYHAGVYTVKLQYKMPDDVENTAVDKLTVKVYSEAPTVKITGIAPEGTFSVDTQDSGQLEDSSTTENRGGTIRGDYRGYWITDSRHITGYSSSMSATSATVYFRCDHTDSSPYGYTNWYGPWSGGYLAALGAVRDNVDYHQYEQPTVTITLAGIGNASKAILAFTDANGNAALLFKNGGGSTTDMEPFTWTPSGDATANASIASTMYVGIFSDASGDDDSKTVAGVVTANKLVLTYGGIDYTFTLATPLTITNNH